MIRPLEFCQSESHFKTSMDTIDFRLLELLALREKYSARAEQIKTSYLDTNAFIDRDVLIEERIQWAQLLSLSPTIVEEIFTILLNKSTNKHLLTEHVFKKNIGNR